MKDMKTSTKACSSQAKTGVRKNVCVGAAQQAKRPVDRSQFCDSNRSSQLFTQ